jgi:hypothetical protein
MADFRQLVGDQAFEVMRDCQRPLNPSATERNEVMAEQRDMSGSFSKNTRKEKPSHADYAGSIVIEGRKFWLNGWIRDGEKGKFLSLSVRAAEEGNGTAKRKPAAVEADGIAF